LHWNLQNHPFRSVALRSLDLVVGEFKAAPRSGADLNSISDALVPKTAKLSRISEAYSKTNLDSNSSTGSACNSLRVAALESPRISEADSESNEKQSFSDQM